MKITDTVTPTDYTVLTTAGENEVHLRVSDSGQRGQNALAQLPRAEFIRAIETELDGTWIDGPLPEVTPLDGSRVKCGNNVYHTDYDHRAEAMERLAVARYLEANPPVGPQVKALADILGDFAIADADTGERDDLTLAKRLVERGVRAPEAGENQ